MVGRGNIDRFPTASTVVATESESSVANESATTSPTAQPAPKMEIKRGEGLKGEVYDASEFAVLKWSESG